MLPSSIQYTRCLVAIVTVWHFADAEDMSALSLVSLRSTNNQLHYVLCCTVGGAFVNRWSRHWLTPAARGVTYFLRFLSPSFTKSFCTWGASLRRNTKLINVCVVVSQRCWFHCMITLEAAVCAVICFSYIPFPRLNRGDKILEAPVYTSLTVRNTLSFVETVSSGEYRELTQSLFTQCNNNRL